MFGLLSLLVSPADLRGQPGSLGGLSGPGGMDGAMAPFPSPPVRRPPGHFHDIDPSGEPLVDIVFEGNVTIPDYLIRQQLTIQTGRPVSPSQVSDDVRRLHETRWFSSVSPVYKQTEQGMVLVFRVIEKPVVRKVEFRGNKKIKDKVLAAETGLKPNAPYDVAINQEAAQRIRQVYKKKGFLHATVTLEKGDDPQDREVIFVINEGPKVRVNSVKIEGNTFASDAVLKLGKETKAAILGLVGGLYNPESVPNDELAIEQYYQNLGFFDVEVSSQTFWVDQEKSRVNIVFHVEEGPRFKVRKTELVGHYVLSEQQLRQDLKLVAGEEFNARYLHQDVESMKSQYDELGRLFAEVNPQIVFLEQPGWVDIVYRIDEDKPMYIGEINIEVRGDHPHTKEDVIRNQVNAYIQPGSLAKASALRRMQARLNGSQLWDHQMEPVSVDIHPVDGAEYLPPAFVNRGQSSSLRSRSELQLTRDTRSRGSISFGHSLVPQEADRSVPALAPGQQASPRPFDRPLQPESVFTPSLPAFIPGHSGAARHSRTTTPIATPIPNPATPTQNQPSVAPNVGSQERLSTLNPQPSPLNSRPSAPNSQLSTLNPQPSTLNPRPSTLTAAAPLWPLSPPDLVIRAQSSDVFYRSQSIDAFGQPVPQDYLYGVSPQGDPYGNGLRGPFQQPPGFIDVDIAVTEAQTGRLMVGAGVNSDAGFVGQIILEENNFDILRPPRSLADITSGLAWRGAGQSFRLEAVPGNEVSRYLVSWQDPFFLNTDFSFGTSGFYYTRFFENWTEERLGGRLTLGRLLGNFWSLGGAIRLENVKVRDLDTPTPPELEAVRGDNFLSTARITLAHDTRDSSFLPTMGHLVEFSYEQGIADFVYPRAEIVASQFLTLRERPDGRGKHILQLRGQAGWTGDDTPIFERFFAGGSQSFRGFEYRGVTPRSPAGIELGGEFLLLGTAEYMFPFTADDNIRGVVFTDVGTVEEEISVENFRASVGAGLRLVIPALGQAPIALDFAYPILKEKFDEKNIFSFYIGFTR